MMKNKHNKLTDNAYPVHLSTHQYKRMMKGFFDTAQKRNEFSSSFGRYRDGICESFSRLRVVGNILLSAQKYNLLNKFYLCIERVKKRCRDFIKNRESQIEKSRKVEMTTL